MSTTAATVYLIITTAVNPYYTNLVVGGVSVTPTTSYQECLELKEFTLNQIKNTRYLERAKENELIITCKSIKKED